ncbi:unnamed protein product [Citrullus colocynthis]|uniref:Pentatricopeptide repeat-containing protein n=1 Tax=Citrullus colocynthis TaxID=252529 RepID=A0ABP0Z699_9ROSI
MSLLTRLYHHRNALLYSTPIITMLIFSYCKRRKSKEALKIFHWMLRPGSPCKPDERVYKTLISGLCRKRMTLDALKVLRNMIDSNLVPDCHLRNWSPSEKGVGAVGPYHHQLDRLDKIFWFFLELLVVTGVFKSQGQGSHCDAAAIVCTNVQRLEHQVHINYQMLETRINS